MKNVTHDPKGGLQGTQILSDLYDMPYLTATG